MRFEEPIDFIRVNFERDDRVTTVLIERPSGAVKTELRTAESACSPRYQAHLRAVNTNGADIYLAVELYFTCGNVPLQNQQLTPVNYNDRCR